MPKKQSKLKAYFINTGTVAVPVWASLGKGITSLPWSYNPQTTTETPITQDNADTSVDGYQVSAAIDMSLWDSVSAPAHAYFETLRTIRAIGEDAETEILEVDLGEGSPYTAQKSAAVVAIDSFNLEGGKAQQLSGTVYLNGDPIDGTVVITDGVPVFTPTAVSAVALSTIVPADGATGIAVGASIVMTFNNQIKAESIFLSTSSGVVVAASKSWNPAKKILTMTPDAALTGATTYLVSIAGVVDIYGQTLAPAMKDFTTA